jgi:hydrogenase maturation protease
LSILPPECRILLLGYGNPGRQDDGLGPALAELLEKSNLPGLTVDAAYQLNIEDAAEAAEYDIVIFADAMVEGEEPYLIKRLTPSVDITFSSHIIGPESILAICQESFDRTPEAWLLAIRGYAFDFEEKLTEKAEANLKGAFSFATDFIIQKIKRWKGSTMSIMEPKTILIIDDDPDIRSSMRIVLEAEGFSVGEAGTGEEGLKIAEEVNPDAVIVDLMMESVDAGSRVSQSLKKSGFKGPIYLLSSAGDSVRFNIDSRDLGLAGIFQKPIDHKNLVNTLKAKLGADA